MTTDKYLEVLQLIDQTYTIRKTPIAEDTKAILLGELCGVVRVACRDPENLSCNEFNAILRERDRIMRKFEL